MEIDAAGGAATAGLIGAAIEKPTGHAGDAHGNCTDCGLPVDGNFCANCGQPTHVHRSLLHLVEEVLHGVVHFDGRIWRTLPLLALNPGRLTREWIQGRRTRYVSPLAIFLFSVFLMFFAFSLGGGPEPDVKTDLTAAERTEMTADLAQAREELAAARTAAEASPDSRALALGRQAASTEVAVLEHRLGLPISVPKTEQLAPVEQMSQREWSQNISDAARTGKMKIDTGNATLDKILKKKALNPELALYKIQQTAYKFSFLLIPLSIPFVALLFLWRKGFTLYDHGVFVIYSLTAISILTLLTVLLGKLWAGFGFLGFLAFTFGVPVHMFAQLKGTYGLGVFSALWRTIALLFFCLLASTLFLLAIIMLGLTG